MTPLRSSIAIALFLTANLICQSQTAQVGDPATLIKEKLGSEIKLTKITAAHDDIVTAGDVILLHKDGMMMCSSDSAYAYSNSYQNGVLGGNLSNRSKDSATNYLKGKLFGNGGSLKDAATGGGCSSRKFVSGEKFWITDIEIAKDNSGIIVSTFSDEYNKVRYYGVIKFPFPAKNNVPPVDTEVKTVEEVLTVVPADDAKKDKGDGATAQGQTDQAGKAPAPAADPAPAPAPTPMAAIAPPPPAADAPPPTIAVGQTRDQVVAGFGQPTRKAQLSSTKEIYFYKDMKVTFVSGKVSNIE
ncbi:hypothetical protein [Terracidiphilus sp.]|jgi:hypothetical protein|uniref:hypothetical protein n=1 Tax=Terracidiphilus sp. TaxID=1964191 RepID=UPI003C13D49F